MLTPRFKISQDDSDIFIVIYAPYASGRDTEVDVDGNKFLFVSSPYFLRLHLTGKIIEDEQSRGTYVCDTGEFKFTFKKETPGVFFENLDMVTCLLAPKDIPDLNPALIEVIEEDGATNGITLEDNTSEETEDCKEYGYGFGNKIIKKFSEVFEEFPEIFQINTPEKIDMEKRHELRKTIEKSKFCSDHYIADYLDKSPFEPALAYKPFWDCENFNPDSDFNEEQIYTLKELPNKHYLLKVSEYQEILFGLVDILFAYCYDKRSFLNDSNIESSWTINKLSSTLSCFCNFYDVKQVLIASYRRSLCYPLYRNFKLSQKVHEDLGSLLHKGKKFLVKCLLDIHHMFNTSTDARYILNQLYINDYLVFLQKCKNEEIIDLSKKVINTHIKRKDLDLEINQLQKEIRKNYGEEVDEYDFVKEFGAMNVSETSNVRTKCGKENASKDSDDDSCDDDSCDDDDSSSSDDSSQTLDSDDSETEVDESRVNKLPLLL